MEKAVKITRDEFCEIASHVVGDMVRANPMYMMIVDDLCGVAGLIKCKLFNEESEVNKDD